MSKNIWRTKMLEVRSNLGPDKISQFNRELSKNLSFVWAEADRYRPGPGGGGGFAASGAAAGLSSAIQKDAARPMWMAYKSFRWEADPSEAVAQSGPYIRWAYPRIVPGTAAMEFFEPAEKDALWTKNSYGIWEPQPHTARKVNLEDCLGVLVPGVAFDRQGHRLGYGKGYYDKALSAFKGLKVGVGFSVQVTDECLPFDETDVLVDFLVTDREILRINKSFVRH